MTTKAYTDFFNWISTIEKNVSNKYLDFINECKKRKKLWT